MRSGTRVLPQFQGCQADQHENHGDDPETDDHARLGPALEFKVVVDRRHAEHALAGQLERRDLDDHRQGLHDEHATHDEQDDFLAHDHGDGAQRGTQCQGTDVAHEDLGRIGVEPQEAEAGADQRAAEHDQLARARYVRDQQVFGEFHVARQVAEDAQGTTHQHGRQDRQAVEAVGQVDRIARADDDEVGQDHEAHAQGNGDVLEHRHDQGGFHAGRGGHVEEDRRAEAEHRLPEVFPAARQATGVLLDDLAVVVDPADGAEQQGDDEHHPDVAVAQVGPEQRAHADGGEDQRTAHGRGAGLGQVRLRAVVAHGLADLADLQGTDHPRAQPQGQRQRGQHTQDPAQGQVLEDREAFVELLQVLSQQQQH
ncbi:hypothetical protein L1887_60088 [Cichorium endivia]|nr:hypothetical protein L1887_60088 [Cichorium endivia]